MITENPWLRLILFMATFAVFLTLESFFPVRSWVVSRFSRLKFSLGLAAVNNILFKIFISTPFVLWAVWVDQQNLGLSRFLGISGGVEILLTVVIFDFLDSFKHRWFHRLEFMWRFHRVHHTDKHLDTLTALRYHPGELVISAVIKSVWILLWGPSVFGFLVFEIILNFSSQFHHSNICFGKWDGLINKIIVTPKYHAIHHTVNREKKDYNFTTVFTIWDKIFGTYADPSVTEINLQNLGSLQERDLSLKEVLLSPLCKDPNNLSKPEFIKEKILNEKAVLIDVREEKELETEGKIGKAIHRPFSKINENSTLLPKELSNKQIPVYVFCKAGVRAEKVVKVLSTQNIQAYNLGGYQDCVRNGL